MVGRKSFITSMSSKHVSELHDKIRELRYGEYDALIKWVRSRGYSVSRSALARYSGELKRHDGYEGSAGSFTLHSAINDAPDRNLNLERLYRELGELEFRRSEVLDRIREIMNSKLSV